MRIEMKTSTDTHKFDTKNVVIQSSQASHVTSSNLKTTTGCRQLFSDENNSGRVHKQTT